MFVLAPWQECGLEQVKQSGHLGSATYQLCELAKSVSSPVGWGCRGYDREYGHIICLGLAGTCGSGRHHDDHMLWRCSPIFIRSSITAKGQIGPERSPKSVSKNLSFRHKFASKPAPALGMLLGRKRVG